MYSRILRIYFFLLLTLIFSSCSSVISLEKEMLITDIVEELKYNFNEGDLLPNKPKFSKIDSIEIIESEKRINVNFNKRFSNQYFREEIVEKIYEQFYNHLSKYRDDYTLILYSLNSPIEELIPNYYRKKIKIDNKRKRKIDYDRPLSVVTNISKPYKPNQGLFNNNIALWHSHGWYYNHKLDRWMWQRARLFQIVEDLGPMAFTIPYLIPMLENAGANVYLPRERDLQINEIVLDNDSESKNVIIQGEWNTVQGNGFSKGDMVFETGENPFELGSYLSSVSSKEKTASVEYIPEIPEKGKYSVYISYNDSSANVSDANYIVYHTGGKTEFLINQQIGGNTWIHLGQFDFNKGVNPEAGKVVVTNNSKTPGKIVSADAVRFGGGKGVIARNGSTSNKPKYIEGARYWLQYAGLPDTLVFNLNGDTIDYKDDYQSRGEWVNYLMGKPNGPNKDRNAKGFGIPVDLSISFHTDAGITRNDSTIGTLAIYSYKDVEDNYIFPDSVSRLANRDFTDLVQTQIVEDIKAKYDPIWNRRELRDALYSEAARPNTPSVLLELLSHQNFLDNKFQIDPRFRFDVSRSIYKAALRFIADQHDREYVVQPLPVSHFATEITADKNIILSWKPVEDPLEITSAPDKYVVYCSVDGNGFDNGILVEDTTYTFSNVAKDKIYRFKVTAINEGGESFPSEVLSASVSSINNTPLLIINVFDRISGPASIDTGEYSGFLNSRDAGVPDKYDLSYTGEQHNFDPSNKWITDDMPGHGASYANYENQIIAGNTFDFTYTHGKSILENGFSFCSVSDESVWDKKINLKEYKIIDLLCGEEKETPWPKEYTDSTIGKQFRIFPDKFKSQITEYLETGGNLFISGSYIATDLFINNNNNDDFDFAKNILRYKISSGHAVKEGKVVSTKNSFFPNDYFFEFNTELNEKIYAVEAPDAITSINDSQVVLRYLENDFPAATSYKGDYSIVAFGFPFETIKGDRIKKEIMSFIINYFTKSFTGE